MKILALDTTGKTASVAIVEENGLLAEYTLNNTMTHSQTILPMVAEVCDKANVTMQEIDYIACACGPGSFTGLRIGAATAKGLAFALGKKIVPVPTLDALAYNVVGAGDIICPIMDARRGQVYTALYEKNGEGQKRISEFLAEPMEDILSIIGERKTLFLGDGVAVHKERLSENPLFSFAPAHSSLQRAASVGMLAMTMLEQAVSGNAFELIYLRKSQAEREREERLGGNR